MADVSPLTLVRASAHCAGVSENDIVTLPPVNCAPEGEHSTESPENEKTPPCVLVGVGTDFGSSGVTDTELIGCPVLVRRVVPWVMATDDENPAAGDNVFHIFSRGLVY